MTRSAAGRQWFVAILEPNISEPLAVTEAVATSRSLLASHIHRRIHRGREELWLVVHVEARSRTAAEKVADDALFPLIWPPERLAEEFPGGRWVVTLGRHMESGPVEREAELLGPAALE